VECPHCLQANPSGAAFCQTCGARVALLCPACRHASVLGSRFCNACGQPLAGVAGDTFPETELTGPTVLASRVALEGERKHVTIVFADLRGSLELLADRDPEDARQLLDPVLERLMEAVHRYEGTVNQVMGDGIMALFGAPMAHEDHALRACRAALEMQASIGRHAREVETRTGVVLRIRVGVHSGEVVVRTVSSDLRMDYTAVGETTHLASRVEQLAEPGTVLLTGTTARLVEGQVALRPHASVPVKGIREPLEVWELVGLGGSRLEVSARRGLTPFIGREAELVELRRALDDAATGHGQVVALVGEPGLGKSRLVWEFLEGARQAGWRILESGGTPYGKGVAYLPVIALIRRFLGLDEGAAASAVASALEAALGPAATPRFLAPLLALLDAPTDDAAWTALEPAQRRQRTLDAVRYLLLDGNPTAPLCLIVEDLHWIDPESQAALDGLVEALPKAPALLLVTYRPEYGHGWTGKTYYAQVPVEPLSHDNAKQLTRVLLGQDPRLEDVSRLVVQRTEGNPFFIEETVRHLVDAHEIVGRPGAYSPVGRLRALEIPASVQSVLAARIDRLAPNDKRLLQVAAAIGTDFGRNLLEAVADLPSVHLGPALGRLRARELIHESRLIPEVEYTFDHALTHEVAYGSLVRERRRELDRRIVEALETRSGEQSAEDLDRLARHAVRGELWEQAVRYCREAGTRAFARSAHRAAAAHFEQALAALRHRPTSQATREMEVDIGLDLRYALSPLGEYRRMLETLTEVERLAAELGDHRRLALASAFLANFFTLRGEFGKAIEHGRHALMLADDLGDTTLAVPAKTVLSLALYLTGDYHEAAALAGANAAVLTGPAARDRFGMALLPSVHSRTVLAWSLAELGQFAGALEAGTEAMRCADDTGHPHSQIFGALGLGLARLRRGDFAEAVAVLERAHEIWQGADLPAVFLELAGPLASALAHGGQASQAIAVLERAVDMAVRLRHRVGHWLGSGGLAEAFLAAGRADEAVPRARMFVEMTRMVGARGSEALALRLLGEATASVDPPDAAEAEAALTGALARARELGMGHLEANCHLTLARLYRRTREVKRAEEELARAIALFGVLEATGWLHRAEAEQAGNPTGQLT